MRSVVDGRMVEYCKKYREVIGRFLLESMASYEADFGEEGFSIVAFEHVEKGNTDEAVRLEDFNEDYSDQMLFFTIVTHPKTRRSFHLCIAYS